ncbi:MAG: hypothetical protein COB69_06430 [Phycisphaera sp.]|nr:MAG: hypothetical protein COB69_06430 [Phycisphaera sp.]
MGRGRQSLGPFFDRTQPVNTPASDKPSLRKRWLLLLFFMLPFVVLIILMYTIAISIGNQGKSLGGDTGQTVSE